MAGVTPNDGKDVLLDRILNDVNTNRTGLELGLMVNTVALTETSVLADVNEVTVGNGYARITLVDGSWSNSGGVASYAQQLFTAVTGPFQFAAADALITGWFIATTGVTPKLLHFHASGVSTLVEAGRQYQVTPSITLTGGAGFTLADEGRDVMLDLCYNDASAKPHSTSGQSLYINTVGISESSIYSDINQVPLSDPGFAAKAIFSGTWVVSGGEATLADYVNTATGNWTSDVHGSIYFYSGAPTTLLWFDPHTIPVSVLNGDSYTVDLTTAV